MFDDPLRPYLQRIGKIKSLLADEHDAILRAKKVSGNTSGALEEAAELMAKAAHFQNLAYQKVTEATANNAELEAALVRASRLPEAIEWLSDTEQIIRLTESLLGSDPVVFARMLLQVPIDTMPLAVQEARSYKTGPAQLEALRRVLNSEE